MRFDYKAIGRRVQQAREAAGFSQEDLGQKIGKSTAAISLFESGERKISLELLDKIADELGVTLKEFIEGYEHSPTYVSFRATKGALDPKFIKALEDAIKKIHEEAGK